MVDVLGNLELEKPALLVVCAYGEDFVDRCVDGKATDQKMQLVLFLIFYYIKGNYFSMIEFYFIQNLQFANC